MVNEPSVFEPLKSTVLKFFSMFDAYSLSLSEMKVCCVYSLELPHRGSSNKLTIISLFIYSNKLIIKTKNTGD